MVGNAINALVLSVSSLRKAETFLSEIGMLCEREEGQTSMAPERIFGLGVRLVEETE